MLALFLLPFTLATVESIKVAGKVAPCLGLETEANQHIEDALSDQVERVDSFEKPDSTTQEMKRSIARAYLFQKHSAKIRLQAVDGNTDLHTAVEVACVKAVKLLLENGANSKLKNKNGDTPLDVAMKVDDLGAKIDIIELLTRYDGEDDTLDETFPQEAGKRQAPAGVGALLDETFIHGASQRRAPTAIAGF